MMIRFRREPQAGILSSALALALLLTGGAACTSGLRPVGHDGPAEAGPMECGPPPVRDFTGDTRLMELSAGLTRTRKGSLSRESQPVFVSTASEAYRHAELRDYQRCQLMHRDGACMQLVAYYERLWTFLETAPSPPEMASWQSSNLPPACKRSPP